MFGAAYQRIATVGGLALAPLPASASILDYVGQCVPFARAASGIQIYGDAWTWWSQAAGKYERGSTGLGGSVYPVHGFIYAPNGRATSELSGRTPDYVGSLIDAYAGR